MILVIGAKGGVGTTLVAAEIAHLADAVGLDLADGQLTARLERPTWALSRLAFAGPAQTRDAINEIVRRRVSLLWTPECALANEKAWAAVRDVGNRCPVVADGGIELPAGAECLAEAVIIVSANDDVARWHERRLLARFPGAFVVAGTKEAAGELADRLFGV